MRLPRQSRGVSFLFLNFGICSARQTPPVLPCRTAVKTETLKRSLFGIYETAFTVVLAGLSSYFGMLTQPLLVLFFAMVLDYLTGMTKAYIFSQLSSRIGVKGILKKLCYMAMVAVGAAVDYLLHGALKQAGIDLHIELFCGLLVAIWLIINELISVMENLAAIGVPGFPRLSKLLERLKNTVSKGDNADEK